MFQISSYPRWGWAAIHWYRIKNNPPAWCRCHTAEWHEQTRRQPCGCSKREGNRSKGQAQNFPTSTGNKHYLQANLSDAKTLPSKEGPGHPREGHQSPRLCQNTACPICAMQWEHRSHTLKKKALFNHTHLCPECNTILLGVFFLRTYIVLSYSH